MRNLKNPFNILAILFPFIVLGGLHFSISNKTAEVFDLSHLSSNIVYYTLFLFIGLGLFLSRHFVKHLLQNKPPTLSILTILFVSVFATLVTQKQVEAKHRVQSDEAIPMSMAQNMKAQGVGGSCDHGIFMEPKRLTCESSAKSFKGKLQASIYRLSLSWNPDPTNFGFGLHLCLYFLSIILMYTGVWLWSKNSFISLVSSSFMAFTPMIMFQFRSLSVEPLHVFLSLLALNVLHFCLTPLSYPATTTQANKSKEFKYKEALKWIFLALTLALFSQTRQESGIAVLAFAIPALPFLMKKPKIFLLFSIVFTLGIIPIVMTILSYRGFNFQGGEGQAHSLSNLIEHIEIAWEQMTLSAKDERLINPFLKSTTYMAAAGLFILLARAYFVPFYRKAILFVALFGVQALIILENVSGDMTITINQRYTLVILPIFAFFIAILWYEVLVVAARKLFDNSQSIHQKHHDFFTGKQNNNVQTWVLSIIVIAMAFSLTFMHRNSLRENIMYKNIHLPEEQSIIHEWMPKKDAFYIYNRPWHFIAIGQSATDPGRFSRLPQAKKDLIFKKFDGRVYYIRGLSCWSKKTYHRKAQENRIPQVCDRFEKNSHLKKLYSTKVLNSYSLNIHQVFNYPKRSSLSQNNPMSNGANQSMVTLQSYGTMSVTLTAPIQEVYSVELGEKEIFRNSSDEFTKNTLHADKTQFLVNMQQIKFQILIPTLTPGIYEAKVYQLKQKTKTLVIKKFIMIQDQSITLLSTLAPISSKQNWGSLAINKSVELNPLSIQNTVYPSGLGTHASSEIRYSLKQPYQEFSTLVGLDDESNCGDGAMFEIIADGQSIYKSPQISNGKALLVKRAILGVKELTLKTHSGSNKDCDHTNWAWPMLRK